ncbi:type VI secretion system contractile sheath large subunit [Vibrio sp. RE88]|uniref:type VI secretion system contractile sheath domain-containing protein n=1 Tax=Vibrio sp. RE88 TaxID=2607610 RepID=UPI00149358F7|nr:type VI secretion system contractile sheath large subunit [Vibrio sp. RE88]NOH61451.1 type VI secretion system contractile sheath large subunit [Vibrio sp. RE88]
MKLNFDADWQQKFAALDSKKSDFLRDALFLLSEVNSDALSNKPSLVNFVSCLVARLDDILSKQLDQIIHDKDFEQLHSSWLGLQGLATLPVNKQRTKLKLLDMDWEEVSADVNQAYNIKASNLFNKIGNQELNTLGGHPFGCIVYTHPIAIDMDFDADYDDLFTVEMLSKLGESTLCPMIFSPDESFFVDPGADWLSDINRIEKIITGPDYQAWQSLRGKPSARFTGFVMPSIRMRHCYRNTKAGFIYNEVGTGLWGNAGFAFAATIMREYHRVNWFGFLKSRWNDKSQGAIVNIDQHNSLFLREPQTNVVLFGQISTFYAQNGFVPLTKSPLSDKYFFNGNNSIWQSGTSDNEKILTQIQTSLMSCRIAHYLKVQVREMLGSFNTAAECELFLTQWVEKFASNVTYANEETLAKYPLSFAKISVSESENQPGSFVCTLRIVPQYQYDHFTGEVVLTTELDEAA